MKKLSKHFKKTLSMIIAITIIMSVCAVSFSTFGNAYTVNGAPTGLGAKTYYTRWKDSVDYDATQYEGAIVHEFAIPGTGDGGKSFVISGTSERVPELSYYAPASDVDYIKLVDKDLNLGSTDGSFVIEKGNTYNVNMTIRRVSVGGSAIIALGLLDASGNIFYVARADENAALNYGKDTFMRFGNGTDTGAYYINTTIDGDAANTYVSGGAAYAGCQVVLIYAGYKSTSATLAAYTTQIDVTDKSAESYTVNFYKDADNTTSYPTNETASIGQGQTPVNTNPLIKINSGNGGTGIHTSDYLMRFCFTGQRAPSKFVVIDDNTLPIPDANAVTYQINTAGNAKKYDYFVVADPDYSDDGIVKIEAGKDYSVSMTFLLNGHSSGGTEKLYWITFGLYNPETGAVYALPYDESTLEGLGNESVIIHNPAVVSGTSKLMWNAKTITAMIDSSKVGPDGQSYAGCQLVVLGGNGGDHNISVNYKVTDASVTELSGDEASADGFNKYDYKPGQPTAEYSYQKEGLTGLYGGAYYKEPYIYYDANGAEPHGLLIFTPSYITLDSSKEVDGVYVPDANYVGSYGYVAINDPDITSANDGALIVEYGKNYSVNFEFYPSQYRDNKSGGDNISKDDANLMNRWVSIGLQNVETGEIFWLEEATYATFKTGALAKKYEVSAFIDSTKVDNSGNAYAGRRVVIIAGGQTGVNADATYGYGNMRVFPAKVAVTQNPDAVDQYGGVAIRPEIRPDDIEKFGDGFEYKYYQSAAIRFEYTVADVIIANATEGGLKVVPVQSKENIGKTDWANVTGAVDSGDLISTGKKYADGRDYDTYAMTITGLTRLNVTNRDLCEIYFDVCFYYVVDGVTFYVPVEYAANSYKDTYLKYAELAAAGGFDTLVYGELEWFDRGY